MIATTEKNIADLGFVFDRQYTHDQFITKQYKKGILTVEFTYEDENLVSSGLTITEDVIDLPTNFINVKKLDELLNNNGEVT